MSNIIEQGPIHSGGLAIDGSPTQILLTRRQHFTPPSETTDIRVANGNGYNDVLDPPAFHSTKQKVIRDVIESALKGNHEVTVHTNGNIEGYESVEGSFKLIGPFVVGSSKVVQRENGIIDSYNQVYRKFSIGRLGLKGVLGMKPTSILKRAQKQFQR